MKSLTKVNLTQISLLLNGFIVITGEANNGGLANKTRILVTHTTEYLSRADRIVVMEKGRIQYFGSYAQLEENKSYSYVNEILERIEADSKYLKSRAKDQDLDKLQMEALIQSKDEFKFTQDENEEIIDVGVDVHKRFFLENDSWKLYVYLVPIFFGQAYFMIYATYYQAKWVENQTTDVFGFYFLMCLLYPLSYCLIIAIKFLIIGMSIINKSKALHNNMIVKILKAPINLFFDKTPSGIILNKFSKDLSKIEDALPE